MEEKEKTVTREKILLAAQNVFIEKGKEGARMQEIARVANVNKAMLFYYFTNKDTLYREVLYHHLSHMFAQIKLIIISEIEPRKKLEQIVEAYINFMLQNPDFPKLFLREVASGGKNIKEVIHQVKTNLASDIPSSVLSMIDNSIRNKEFRKVDPVQTIISIVGMCVIYFVGKPLIETLFELNPKDERQFIEKRKKSILKLLEYGILTRPENVQSKIS